MDVDEFKEQVAGVLEHFGIPGTQYEDNCVCNTWNELEKALKQDARYYGKLAARLAGYAGAAARKAKRDRDRR